VDFFTPFFWLLFVKYEKKDYTVKVNNSTIINKMNDHLLSHIIMARDRYKNVAGLNQHMP
jgi:hypothetical protein